MMAFRYAADHGADGVECDVMLTKDGKIAVMHDESVDRVLDGKGPVSEMTMAELQSLPYKTLGTQEVPYLWHNADWDTLGERIDRVPSLEHLIMFCKKRNLKLMIELKEVRLSPQLVRLIAALFAKHDLYKTAYVASFNPYHMYLFRRHYPQIATCLLYCRDLTQWYHEDKSDELRLPRWINFRWTRYIVDVLLVLFAPNLIAGFLGVDMIGPHNVLVSRELITEARAREVVTDMWVVNSELEAQYFLSLGALVTTDSCFRIPFSTDLPRLSRLVPDETKT